MGPVPQTPRHAAFLAALPAEAKARLQERSDPAGLRHLALHAGAILAMGALIVARVPGWPALVPVQGVAIAFLFTLQHECTHRTPFASERLNEWVGRAAGVLILQPFTWFRHFHLAHHRWTNDPERDPELEGGKPETPAAYALHVSGWPYWRAHGANLVRCAFGTPRASYVPARALPRIRAEARAMLALYAAALASLACTPVLFWAWMLPVVVGMPALRLYVLAEHGRCAYVADMFENTRTTLTNRLLRGLAWNMPYHAEHHAFPNVPFHRLPELHALAVPELGVVERGYRRFHRGYLASLRGRA
jgi:fatty acid desaturase